jgi:hypothetical protein
MAARVSRFRGVARALFSILRGRIEVSTWLRTRRYNAAMDTYTLVHVILSLIGILSGLVVLYGLFTANPMNGWTLLFLVTTAATSLTGFGFPFHGVTPAIIVGILSLLILTAAIAARYAYHLAGSSRWIYVVGTVVALYFNVFVLVVQSFLHIPALHALAPKGSESPFAIAQGIVLVLFIAAGILAVKKFPPDHSLGVR